MGRQVIGTDRPMRMGLFERPAAATGTREGERAQRAYRGALRITQMGRRGECRDAELLILADLFIHRYHQTGYRRGIAVDTFALDDAMFRQAEASLRAKGMLQSKDGMPEPWWIVPDGAIDTVQAILCRLAG